MLYFLLCDLSWSVSYTTVLLLKARFKTFVKNQYTTVIYRKNKKTGSLNFTRCL